jgi:hypothetical protein
LPEYGASNWSSKEHDRQEEQEVNTQKANNRTTNLDEIAKTHAMNKSGTF